MEQDHILPPLDLLLDDYPLPPDRLAEMLEVAFDPDTPDPGVELPTADSVGMDDDLGDFSDDFSDPPFPDPTDDTTDTAADPYGDFLAADDVTFDPADDDLSGSF